MLSAPSRSTVIAPLAPPVIKCCRRELGQLSVYFHLEIPISKGHRDGRAWPEYGIWAPGNRNGRRNVAEYAVRRDGIWAPGNYGRTFKYLKNGAGRPCKRSECPRVLPPWLSGSLKSPRRPFSFFFREPLYGYQPSTTLIGDDPEIL